MIALTLDIDWAPDEVIEYVVNKLESYQIKCTIFSTHESSVIKSLINNPLFEIAIHPNFNLILDNKAVNFKKTIIDLLNIYPEAVGVRSHSMTQSTRLLDLFYELGLKYDSNQFFPFNTKIYPYMGWNNLYRIPYNWEDDVMLMYNSINKVWISKVDLLNDYWIFDFHPMHIFMNTISLHEYENIKPLYQRPELLKKKKNTSLYGIENFFNDLLEFIHQNKIKTFRLKDVYEINNNKIF